MSHSTLRAFFYFLSGEKFIKNAKIGQFLKPENFGHTVLPDRSILMDKSWWKKPKYKNTNETLWVIFKQCDFERQIPERLAKALKVWQPGFEDSDTVEYTKVGK